MHAMKKSFVTPILKTIAKRIGVKMHIEPEYGYVAQIELSDGRKRYFRNTNFDINLLGASEIAKDKAYAAYFMKRMGYPVPTGKAFFTREWAKVIGKKNGPDAAFCYAKTLGFPVIVKPNSKSQGSGVCKVFDKKEFVRAVTELSKNERVFLVQKLEIGNDYRIVVLDKEIISAYQRLPLSVTGDGTSTIQKLLKKKQTDFVASERDTVIPIDDFRITSTLGRLGLSQRSVLPRGKTVALLTNANLSTGGDAMDVTDSMHQAWRKLAICLTRDMGLRYCGVDVMVHGTLAEPPKSYVILEVNAAPGLDNYASSGKKQHRLVINMYEKVLRAMMK